MVDRQNLDELRSVEELSSYQKVVVAGLVELDTESAGLPFKPEQQEDYAYLRDTNEAIKLRVKEIEARKAYIASLAEDPKKVERAFSQAERQFNDVDRSAKAAKERDIYDLRTIQHHPSDHDAYRAELRERAQRAIELTRFATAGTHYNDGKGVMMGGGVVKAPNQESIQAHLERMLDDTQEAQPGDTARHILATGGPVYRRAFWKKMTGAMLDREEERALSLTGSGGGFAIPFALDPSIIPTSNSVVNPARALARLVTISGANTWQGVTSPAVVATRAAEGQEATDNSTTLVQPQVTVTKTHVAIPFSIEVWEDWPQLESEFGRLIQDSKDDEEGASFITGVGTTVFPQGFVTGTTATSAAATGLTVTAANVRALEAALAPRFRPRESFVANRGIYNVIAGIDTAGGAALWLYLAQGLATQAPTPGNTGAVLIGRGAWEASAMQATVVNATKIMIVGDFSYFLIVDRIGMTVELIQNLVGAANRLPTGQRALYAYWRNSSKVLSASAFVAMTGTT